MGFSKHKQKKEGLMSQMKSKTELSSPAPSPAPVSPSQSFCQTPPPRNLATTLASNECGRADSLRFVLELRALDSQEGEILEHNFARYFPLAGGGGLVLDNQELW